MSYADDYGDFKISGMSIGDSLLKHYSIDQILNARNYDDYPSDMKFRIIDIFEDNKFYDAMQFYIKQNDKNFIIQSLNGRKIFKNINDCYIEKKKLESELSALFASAEKYEQRSCACLPPTGCTLQFPLALRCNAFKITATAVCPERINLCTLFEARLR